MTDPDHRIPLSFLGVRLTGSRLSADSYLDLLAIVAFASPAGEVNHLAHRALHLECARYGRDEDQVCARVALYFGACVPEVEEP